MWMFDRSKIDDKKFEELCLQIAKNEFSDKWEFIPINWIGWDWWREFYLKLENWERWSWQCKLFNKLDNPQKKQIKESLKTCLRNDWNKLRKRFLCIPIDLTDTIKQKNNTIKKRKR